MFASLTALAVLAAALVARADPTPSEPGPGAVYNEGATCRITWDTTPANAEQWKEMNIQLMTGDNFNMIHLTTVGTVDGSAPGIFTYPCPNVEPNSAIYFYQFTSPVIQEAYWATRFTIAGPNGQTTPPPNARQPGTNDPIPWGVGRLEDPSSATPPPTRGGVPGGGASSPAPSSALPSSASESESTPASETSTSSAVTPTITSSPAGPTNLPTTSFPALSNTRFITSTSTSTSTPTASGIAEQSQNGAISRLAAGYWASAVVFSISTFGMVMLL
ncbi:hypothetical protein ONZ45_g6918 [Pleurotus djamor]|nr:hypothetical protein ONZ45_g6918 [Pleurotus djamor]